METNGAGEKVKKERNDEINIIFSCTCLASYKDTFSLFLHFFPQFVTEKDIKTCLDAEKDDSASKRCAKHQFAD